MATRSRIGIQHQDGSVTSIYCHWSGVPEFNGYMLREHYQDRNKVMDLIILGNISSLHESIECPEGHTFDTPVKGYTVAYSRDRLEPYHDNKPIKHNSFEKYRKSDLECYGYLFTLEDKWICIDGHSRKIINLENV